jgi:hypothetical protein
MLWLMHADLRRERIGMIFGIDSSTGAATRTDRRRLFHGRQMSGGKVGKGGNLEALRNTGLADDVTRRRKPAETLSWGPVAVRKYSWRGFETHLVH